MNGVYSFYTTSKLHSFALLVLLLLLALFLQVVEYVLLLFSAPKHGSVSDLEEVVPHLIAAAVRKARMYVESN